MAEPRRCPVCGDVVGLGFGRPATYCSADCRREMARRRRRVAELEAEIVDARIKFSDGYAPGRYFWKRWTAMLERQAAELRDAIPEEMRP